MAPAKHAWQPVTSCVDTCVEQGRPTPLDSVRQYWRIALAVVLLMMLPLLTIPLPKRSTIQRLYCRVLLRSLGVRVSLSGDPIRNLPGVLVVSNHVSWLDVLAVGAVLPGTFVARADLVDWPALGPAARIMKIIPIERANLRQLPGVVDAVTDRLRDGRTVIAFPEGTTYCGRDHGQFRPALFQAAIESGRPIQPLRVAYRRPDGHPTTVTAFFGDDSLGASMRRITRTRLTLVEITVLSLQLPDADRRELAARCQEAVHDRPRPAAADQRVPLLR